MFSPFFDIKNLLQLFKHGYFNAKSWTPSFLTRILTAIRFCALLELHPVAAIRVEFSRNQSRGENEEFLSVLLTFGVSHGKITMNKVVNSAKMRINMQQQSSGCPWNLSYARSGYDFAWICNIFWIQNSTCYAETAREETIWWNV